MWPPPRVWRSMFTRTPKNADDPSAGYVWESLNWSAGGGPLSTPVKARLTVLSNSGYFGAQHCAVSYLDGTQDNLLQQPTILAARANDHNSVVVVLQRAGAKPQPPNLTVVMTQQDGTWRVTDLASGTGPSASIFSVKPNC
jgi:hypothetical protein